VADPGQEHPPGGVVGDVGRPEQDPAVTGVAQAEDRLDQLVLAVALHAGDADDLAGPHVQADRVDRGLVAVVVHGQPVDREHGVAGVGSALVDAQEHRPADHEPRQLGGAGVGRGGRGHHLAATHHRDAVRHRHHLGQLVRDEDDGGAGGRELVHHLEEPLRLRRRQHGRRLVEHEHPSAAIERLQDLHALLDADGKVGHACARVHLEPVPTGQVGDVAPGLVQVHDPAGGRLVAQHDVLGHRERRDQHEVLVHHADAQPDRVDRAGDLHRLPVQEDLAVVRPREPVDHVHQRRLAGAVLAEEGVDLTPSDGEVHAVVGAQRAVHLDDAAQLEGGSRGRVAPAPHFSGQES
jgi:hypothetical protein